MSEIGSPTPPPFRVIVTGDRNWHCRAVAREAVRRLKERYGGRLVIVHGNAPGVDRAFAEACELQRVTCEAHPAELERYSDRAGPLRNQNMVDAGPIWPLPCIAPSPAPKARRIASADASSRGFRRGSLRTIPLPCNASGVCK